MEWTEQNNRLYLKLNFNNQTDLVNFLLKVAKLADENNHHPDIKVSKATCLELELFTHDKGAITDKDYDLADQIQSLSK